MSLKYTEVASMSREFSKLAEEDSPKKLPEHPMKTFAKGVGAYGLGTGLGYGGVMAARHFYPESTSKLLRGPGAMVLPVATGLGALLFHIGQDEGFHRIRKYRDAKDKLDDR
jgi:hypothetical protein